MLNLCVWNKTNAGQGSFYRSQHELVIVSRVGDEHHQNNIELGRFGRNRSNVWTYQGMNSCGTGRLDALHQHPTVKPIAMIADALRDSTSRNEAVLDIFSGSGTIFLAAEKVGRRGFGLEIEPRYVDVAIKRWEAMTRRDAVLEGDRRTFAEIAASRSASDLL
jgi:DNA modification methylase